MEAEEIQELVGEWLASGFSDDDIIKELVAQGLSEAEAVAALRNIYDHWQTLREGLDLNESSLGDWHIFLRKRILQTALATNTIASLRLALSILDSLATIHGVAKVVEPPVMPLQITLVEKVEEHEPEEPEEPTQA